MQKPLRVLMVEDSEDDALLTMRALTKGGYEPVYSRVETAGAMSTALREKTWDVLLCDYRLPQFSGLAAIALLKDTGIDLPLIIVSSTIGEETAADCMRYGAVDWVRKSNLSRLVPAIERELKEAESRRKRKQAEEDLLKSEEKYRSLLDNASDAIFLADIEGNLLEINKKAEELLGYSKEEALSINISRIHPAEVLGKIKDSFNEIITKGSGYVHDVSILRKDGKIIPVDITGSLIEWSGTKVAQGIFRDTTERKLAEEELKDRAAELTSIYENAPFIMILADREWKIQKSNVLTTQFVGRALGEMINLRCGESLHCIHSLDTPEGCGFGPACRECTLRLTILNTIETGQSHHDVEVMMSLIKGEKIWDAVFLLSSTKLTVKREPVALVSMQDITERRQAEDALHESEEKYRSLFENSIMGISQALPDGRLITANNAYAQMYGYANAEEMMVKASHVVHRYANPEDREEVLRILKEDGVMQPREVAVVRRNGTRFTVLVSAREIRDSQGNLRYYQAEHIDITNRKQAEEALRERNSQIQKLTAWVPGMLYQFKKRSNSTYCVPFTTEAIKDIFGCSPQDVHEDFSPIARVILPEDLDKVVGSIEYSAQHLTIWICEYRVQIPGQSIRWILGKSTPEKLADGSINWYGFNTDITERKRTEEELRQSEENFRHSFDDSPLGVRIVTVEGETIYANRAILDIYGFDNLDELKATPPIKRYTPESYAEFQNRRDKRQQGVAVPSKYFIDIIRKDGEVRHLQVFRKEILWDGERQFQVIYSDITERQQADEALRKSQEQLIEVHRLAHIGVWNWVAETDTVTWTEELYRIAGLDPMLPAPTYAEHTNIYAPESWELLKEAVERSMKTGGTYQLELKLIRPDGTPRWVNAFGGVTYDNHARVTGLRGTVQDITEREQMRAILQETDKQYRQLAEDMPALICTFLPDSTLTYVNSTYCELFQKRSDELIGQKFLYFIPDEVTRESVRRHYMSLTPENSVKTYEHDLIISDGINQHHWHRWTDRAFFKDNGEIDHFQSIGQDITDRKQAEEELRTSRLQLRALYSRLQQIREEERLLVAREIHDEMGGGLTGLKMDLSWLLREIGDAGPVEARVAWMDKLQTANTLIDQMIREVRRIASALRPSILDDLGLIAALEWQLSEFTSRTEIPHEFATTFEYINMEEDTAVAVFRIFQEALTNVVRHSRATKVVVDLREGERSLFGDESFILEIRDNGRGITEEEILHQESLGLLGMKERVLAFGGEISIHGEPGGGTALVLKIPHHKIPSLQA